ncbi:MAG: DUF4388 domain-containing protein [Vicinamibacteria bacterium]|jgi:hypothetical protein|nr:DUF4388 domain-containing protein [Vicinamibacteria bacterium]
MEKILEGDLARFAVPDLLTFLNMGRRTGVLVLERTAQETKVFLNNGDPIFANTSRPELRFGEVLVRQKKIREEDISRILKGQQGSHRLGELLLSEKLLTRDELETFLKVQVSEVIFDTFEWPQGTFLFYDQVPPPSTVVMLRMDLQNLIMEGVRRLDERAHMSEIFPDLNLIVEAVANTDRIKQTATFTPEEWRIFFLVDGRRTLADICQLASDMGQPDTLAILHRLVKAKFLNLTSPPPEPAAGAQKAPEPPVSVLPAAPAPRQPDDSREIVNPRAVQYQIGDPHAIMAQFRIIAGGTERSLALTRDTYALGRHRNNDIVVADPKVSSFHARVERNEEGYTLQDLGSRNGTFVNGRRESCVRLKNGDKVQMGMALLLYKVDLPGSS